MLIRIVRRTAQMVLVVFGVATIVFFVLRLAAGDPARLMTPPGTPESVVEATRDRIGTDRPLLVQYGDYLADLVRGNLGESFHGGQPVLDEVVRALPNTAVLALVTILVASAVGLLLGIAAALRANGVLDRAILVYVALGQATPAFWLAVVLVLFFAVQLRWLPAIDLRGPESFVLPVATLVLTLSPILIRIVRQSFLETLGEDHVRAARARGL